MFFRGYFFLKRIMIAQAVSVLLASWVVDGHDLYASRLHGRSVQPLRSARATASFLRLNLTSAVAAKQGRGGADIGHESKAETSTVAELVASIEEIMAVLDGWQASSKTNAKSYADTCKESVQILEKMITKGKQTIQESTEDLEAVGADAAGVKADLESQKESIKATSEEIDQLISDLKAMRDAETRENSDSTAALQQVDAVIKKASQQEHVARLSARSRVAQLGSDLSSKVSELEVLGNRLQIADSPVVALVQTGAQTRWHLHSRHKSRSRTSLLGERKGEEGGEVRVLQQDKKTLQEAVHSAEEDFDEKEKENIELTRIKRAELKGLEAGLRDLQPALADKLKREADTNRTLLAAKRGVARDEAILATKSAVCPALASISTAEHDTRFKLSGVLRMAIKTLETMDATVFLARDLKDLEPNVQPHRLQRRHHGLTMRRARASAPMPSALALVQVASWKGLSANDASVTEAGSTGSGPFSEVSAMIGALIAQLEEQGVSDTDRQQFCTESIAKTRASKQKSTNALSVVRSQILFTEAAIARLNDEIAYFNQEAEMLGEAATQSKQTLTDEVERRVAEEADMQTAFAVITKAADVLVELCDLPSSTPATSRTGFLASSSSAQAGGSLGRGKKGTQCELAREFLEEASTLIQQGDQARAGNKAQIATLFGDISTKAQSDAEDQAADLLAARQALARRVDELAAARADVEVKTKDLALIATAQKELDTNCSPKQETHEERMQRRTEEIDALKNALRVLDGESVPVSSEE